MPTDLDDTLLPFALPSLCKKKVTAAFDGGQISSDGGVLLLAGADKRLGLIDTLARLMPDHRDPAQMTHTMSDILRARVFAIACGYPDADDLDDLRKDPAFKMACGRLPETSDDLASQPTMSRWETTGVDAVRDYTETSYAAQSWSVARRVVARIEATYNGLDTRYVVTNITRGGPQWLYDTRYCARGQAENLIKRHKSQLASDRTSCRSPLANQMRLMLTVRNAIARPQSLPSAEFSTLRLLKIAVRVRETASRVRLAFAANCPDAPLFHGLVGTLILNPT